MELCNGSAVIIDVDIETIAYTITSAGHLFDGVVDTVNYLKSQGHEIFLRHYLSLSPTPKDNKKPHNGGYLIHDFNFTTYRYHY